MDKSREAVKEGYDIGKLLRGAVPKALYAFGGYLVGLATLPFGASPLGVALLSAADRNALFVYCGLIISCVFGFEGTESFTRIGIYTAILLLRVLVRLTLDLPFDRERKKYPLTALCASLFFEKPAYRFLLSAVGALSLGLCYLAGSGFLYYDLFGLLISVAVAPLAAYLFGLYFCKKGVLRDIGAASICMAAVYGALPLKLYGVSLAVFGAMFATFFITQRRGLITGALTGLGMGLVYSPILSPIFPAAALCAALFMKISPALAAFSAFAISAAWGFYIKGIYALDGLFAGVLSACLLYTAFHKLFVGSAERTEKKTQTKCALLPESELDGVRLFDTNRRMNAISRGFERLVEICEEMKLRFPRQSELEQICADAFDSSCSGCSSFDECRKKVDISEESNRLARLLRSDRGVSSKDISAELTQRCTRMPDILDEINYNSGVRIRGASTESFAPDYQSISRLLERSMEGEANEYKAHDELSRAVCGAIEELGLSVDGALVYGSRKRTVYIKGERELLERERRAIIEGVARVLPFELDCGSAVLRRCAADKVGLFVGERERIKVSYATRQMRARGEIRFCGDSLCLFKNEDNRFFALVSDGMGSGREASETSEICVGFLHGMLSRGGVNCEILSALNGFLCRRNEGSAHECSATVDLMELDLIKGEASFYKSGAAPSYVFRDGSLFKLRSRTMPIGILRDTEIKSFNFELSEGDVVVMMSDGVTGGKEECPWLFDLLRQNLENSGLERTADLIMKYAVGHGSDDDISLAVIRIEKA